MFNVHKVTFRYVSEFNQIWQFSRTLSFNIVTKLFGVWVVNYEVMDLQKSDKCNQGYFLDKKFVMWEHE